MPSTMSNKINLKIKNQAAGNHVEGHLYSDKMQILT